MFLLYSTGMTKLSTSLSVFHLLKNWSVYFFDYFCLIRRPLHYTLRNGVHFSLRGGTTDQFIFTEVWLYSLYRPALASLPQQPVIVDIGAQIGFFFCLACLFYSFCSNLLL